MPASFALATRSPAVVLLAALVVHSTSAADKPAAKAKPAANAEAVAFFEKKIRPVLVKNCYSCHSKDAKKLGGKLLLDSAEGLKAGGQSGPVVEPGNAEASTLIQALKFDGLEMPPDQPLPDAVIADFVKWVEMGAAYPAAKAAPKTPDSNTTANLWSLAPIANPAPPDAKDERWSGDIDRFVRAKLDAAGLTPNADADARTLIRRLHFDITGLPPTFEQVEAFIAEHTKDPEKATAKLVDELLASPRFGERWGRHWLDVARFGESNGNDGLSRNPTFPHAWRYRDYVIQSFNDDVPYDRFLAEQIAGDLLPAATPAERERLWIATGFLAVGSKPAKAMNTNFDMDIVADQIEVVGTGVMGLSVACARCHDHKHDPIPTKDYYALAGIFASTETLYGLAANEPLTAPATELYVLKTAKPLKPPASTPKVATGESDMAAKPKAPAKAKYPPGTPLAMGARERAKPADCKINIQGETAKLGPSVPRGFVAACGLDAPAIDAKQSGRLQLAKWLTNPRHPLTARVMVNRVWLQLFGRGLVNTPDDFGTSGEAPSHPELLDYLASMFVAEKWSVKSLIRTIVLSRTYRLSSADNATSGHMDPDNALLWRHSRRRLDAESLRDSVLLVSGKLDLAPAEGSDVAHLDVLVNKAGNLHRPSVHRSVFLCRLRNSDPPDLAAFDLPDSTKPVGQRPVTTLPSQSLFLMNSAFMVEQSGHFAALLGGDVSSEAGDAERIRSAYRKALDRDPQPAEVQRAAEYLQAIDASLAKLEPDRAKRRTRAWTSFAQALLTSSEFRFID